MDVRPGVVLNGSYRILKPLAAGGVGKVYLAAHERLPGQVAVKVLHRNLLRDRQTLARFRNEAELLAGLNHPNIVKVLDYNVSEAGVPYLVMELVEGVELRKLVGQPQQRDPAWVASAVRQAASALRAAHLQGIVHRDIKPENLMVCSLESEADFIKVLDFGVSNVYRMVRTTVRRRPANDADFIVGTPGYMAPEQLTGAVEVDDRADQFGLAAVAWELLAGRPAFLGTDEGNLLYKMLNEDAPCLSDFVEWEAADVDTILRRAMAKDRDERFHDIQEFSKALEQALAEAIAPPPAPVLEPPAAIAATPSSEAASSEAASSEAPSIEVMPLPTAAPTPVPAPRPTPTPAPLPESDPALIVVSVTVEQPVPLVPMAAAPAVPDEFGDVGQSYLW